VPRADGLLEHGPARGVRRPNEKAAAADHCGLPGKMKK
jgi:hypothetical protein